MKNRSATGNSCRLAEEAARLDPTEERALAEEGLAAEAVDWPAYPEDGQVVDCRARPAQGPRKNH